MSSYIDAVGQAYKEIQEKKLIDPQAPIDGGTQIDPDGTIQEGKFVIPEEIPANERTAFHGAAAAAAKAGKKSFSFNGKTHPVTMAKDTANKIADDVQKEMSSKEKMKKGLYNDTQKEGMYKDMDTEKSEPNPRTDMKVKADTKKRKGPKDEVEMNPKMEKEKGSMEQKESVGIRQKLMAVLENDRAKHYKGATKPDEQPMDRNASAKKMKDGHGEPKVDDTETKGHEDSKKAGRAGPAQAKARSGGDNIKNGDTKIVPGGTPTNKLTKTMEAYASMSVQEELTMKTHEGEETHIIAGHSHTEASAKKVRHAVIAAAAKHAGVSHEKMKKHHEDMRDEAAMDHHYLAAEPVKKGTKGDKMAGRGGHGDVYHHKNLDSYIKHHAKADAETYHDRHNYY